MSCFLAANEKFHLVSFLLKVRAKVFSFFFSYCCFILFWDKISCSQGWPWSCYVTNYGLEFLILLPSPPKCRDDRSAPPHWLFSGSSVCRIPILDNIGILTIQTQYIFSLYGFDSRALAFMPTKTVKKRPQKKAWMAFCSFFFYLIQNLL